ncbi:hypothetical protein [Flagellimonas flava]|uniref:Outer membrane protein beta-barrel domain-containing protein n=1 Tax=Flagellimonas flava TaxID=570519 RepID=A0A1M5M314_9FLAO|nr:hypothetical protein [Allomuricauda flava]SHG71309.1 hypothetical protein SAMN04488116_2220 [Allomuricauda flava]
MIKSKIWLLLLLAGGAGWAQDQNQDEGDYIEFNDRRNVVHGVYLGLGTYLGEIDGKSTFHGNFKIAYVANQQVEVGFAAVGFYSQQNIPLNTFENLDFAGGYAGLHVEPILFGKSKLNLSFPVMLGAGAVVYVEDNNRDVDIDFDRNDWDEVFVVEPGVNLLFNLSRFVQLEAGMRYRFSSRIDLEPNRVKNINGFSAGFGIKVGIFNMGRNRYKKHIRNEQ